MRVAAPRIGRSGVGGWAAVLMTCALWCEGARAYAPFVHVEHSRQPLRELLGCGEFGLEACAPGLLWLVSRVQERADARGANGDKNDGRLYLHFIRPMQGYASSAGDTERSDVGPRSRGALPRHALSQARVHAAEQRYFAWVLARLSRKPPARLEHDEVGQLIYGLATLLHAHQDRKHLEGNWTAPDGRGITTFDHFSLELHQLWSDLWPSQLSAARSVARTRAFLARFRAVLDKAGVTDSVLASMREFRPTSSTASSYRPVDMEALFPSYPTGGRAGELFWSARIGWDTHPQAGPAVLDFGVSYELLDDVRLRPGLLLGGSLPDGVYHGKVVVVAGDRFGFLTAGVGLAAFLHPKRGSEGFAVIPTVTLLDDLVVLEAQYRVGRAQSPHWAFVAQTDLLFWLRR